MSEEFTDFEKNIIYETLVKELTIHDMSGFDEKSKNKELVIKKAIAYDLLLQTRLDEIVKIKELFFNENTEYLPKYLSYLSYVHSDGFAVRPDDTKIEPVVFDWLSGYVCESLVNDELKNLCPLAKTRQDLESIILADFFDKKLISAFLNPEHMQTESSSLANCILKSISEDELSENDICHALREFKDLDNLEKFWLRKLDKNPNKSRAYLELIDIYLDSGEIKSAKKYAIDLLTEISPNQYNLVVDLLDKKRIIFNASDQEYTKSIEYLLGNLFKEMLLMGGLDFKFYQEFYDSSSHLFNKKQRCLVVETMLYKSENLEQFEKAMSLLGDDKKIISDYISGIVQKESIPDFVIDQKWFNYFSSLNLPKDLRKNYFAQIVFKLENKIESNLDVDLIKKKVYALDFAELPDEIPAAVASIIVLEGNLAWFIGYAGGFAEQERDELVKQVTEHLGKMNKLHILDDYEHTRSSVANITGGDVDEY